LDSKIGEPSFLLASARALARQAVAVVNLTSRFGIRVQVQLFFLSGVTKIGKGTF
jgi:hypothetical protein